MGTRSRVIILLLISGIFVIITTFIFAQAEKPQDAINQQTATQNTEQQEMEEETEVEDDAIKLFLDKIEVLGELEKPQAVFIIPGADPTIDDIKIDRSFFNEIFRSVEKIEKVKQIKKEDSKDNYYLPW